MDILYDIKVLSIILKILHFNSGKFRILAARVDHFCETDNVRYLWYYRVTSTTIIRHM